jgi:hypothetical protein
MKYLLYSLDVELNHNDSIEPHRIYACDEYDSGMFFINEDKGWKMARRFLVLPDLEIINSKLFKLIVKKK